MEDRENAFTTFRSAAEQAATKHDEGMVRDEQAWDNEGGRVSPTGRPKGVDRTLNNGRRA